MNRPLRCVVLGAAGRDLHDLQTFFKSHPDWRVVAITAAQVPFFDRNTFPRELAGPGYDADIPIRLESELPAIVREHAVDFVVLSYSDLSHAEVMHKASLALSLGAGFTLLPPREPPLHAHAPW
jgi:predicted GTPase